MIIEKWENSVVHFFLPEIYIFLWNNIVVQNTTCKNKGSIILNECWDSEFEVSINKMRWFWFGILFTEWLRKSDFSTPKLRPRRLYTRETSWRSDTIPKKRKRNATSGGERRALDYRLRRHQPTLLPTWKLTTTGNGLTGSKQTKTTVSLYHLTTVNLISNGMKTF